MIYENIRKNISFKKNDNDNINLISCILKTREDLITANNNYEFADGELIDYYLYQIKATQSKYNYLLKKAKKNGVLVTMLDQLEIKNSDIAI